MAEIEVSFGVLESLLFTNEVDIIGYRREDPRRRSIIFEITGTNVPDVSKVTAEITEYYKTVKFIPVKEKANV